MVIAKFMSFRAIVCIASLFFCFSAQAEEVINRYDSKIDIQTDGSLHVTETITVTSEGDKIRRGIYRDFPLYRRTFLGGRLPSDYSILSVQKNSIDEPWHTEVSEENAYLRLYIGQSDIFLENGVYQYDISYKIPQQVFFFNGYDELNWNVIGTGWDFPIEQASATITLPKGALSIRSYQAYTGTVMSRDKNYKAVPGRGRIFVETTKPLLPGEGLTVALSWPAGFVNPTKDMVGTGFFLKQHPGLLAAFIGLVFLVFYYYLIWFCFGRDPKSRGLAPFYSPPEGLSPAMCAVISTMDDVPRNLCMSASIISLASKGYLTIQETRKGSYSLFRCEDISSKAEMSEDEKILYDAIGRELKITRSCDAMINASAKHAKYLTKVCEGRYFFSNTWWWLSGFLIFFITLCVLSAHEQIADTFWIGVVFVAVFGGVSLGAMIYGLKQIWRGTASEKFSGIFLIIWASAFSVGGFLGLFLLSLYLSWLVIVIILLMLFVVLSTRVIMKAPTIEGREMMDHINGLRYYMETVEEKVLKKFNPPEMSRELYEKYLPYAVALGVESKWADKFSVAMGSAMIAAGAAISTSPHWYSGTGSGVSSGFSPQVMVSSFGSALAASTSSNSSSSGGGSSGGGGGGGGGGGW